MLKEDQILRSDCGGARIHLNTKWYGKTKPYATFRNGTACLHFESEHRAISYLQSFGFTFDKWGNT